MARERPFIFSLNGGQVSPLSMARVDLQRMRLTAQEYTNCIPRVIGPLMFRPGLKYLDEVPSFCRQIPFVFNIEDTALIVISDGETRIFIDDQIITRPDVATVITNGDFASAAGWTLTTTGGGVASINSLVAGSLVLQTPVRGGTTMARASAAVALEDRGIEHAVRFQVSAGTVRLRIGSTAGGQEHFNEQEFEEGIHSIVFIPTTGTVHFQLSAKSETYCTVDSIQIEEGGVLVIPSPWGEADISRLRHDQSGDVVFITHEDHQPIRIERRGHPRAWSLSKFKFSNGPWQGKTANVSLSSNVRLGNGILTASAPFFTEQSVGAIFELSYTESISSVQLAGSDVYTDSVRVSGKNEGTIRQVTRTLAGTWVGTGTVQVSHDDEETWQNFTSSTVNYSATGVVGSDNAIVYVRIGFQAGDYTSGILTATVQGSGGGGTGVVRVTGYISPTQVSIEVVKRLHFTGATENWQEGKYSDENGWPASVTLFENRLWFGGADQLAGSYSDEFNNFDVNEEGDSAPIIRSIATGPVNKVQWMLGLSRLIIGTSGAESVARSSSFDEPMTPTNFSIKDASTYGSADVAGVKVDRSGVFAHRSGKRVYMTSFSVEQNDYVSNELTRYNPSILSSGVKILAVQREPDTRIWAVLNDGTAAVLTLEQGEDVISWWKFETDGEIEDICVLPNAEADDVHVIVRRTIDGVPRRYRERLAYDSEAMGGINNYMADSFVVQTLANSATLTGLSHLAGKDVVVWADGHPLLTEDGNPALFPVIGGAVTLPAAVTGTVIAGLPYEGRWKSTKLAYAAQSGTAISQRKIITSVAPLLYSTHNRAVLFGQSFDNMEGIPRMIKGVDSGPSAMIEDYDYDGFAVPGKWETDARLCMRFRAPLPATVLGLVLGIESHERA